MFIVLVDVFVDNIDKKAFLFQWLLIYKWQSGRPRQAAISLYYFEFRCAP